MRIRDLSEQALRVVSQTLEDWSDPELDRMLVMGALVVRDGNHYWIESGAEEWRELEARACRLEGLCDCGALLSVVVERMVCRVCAREFPA